MVAVAYRRWSFTKGSNCKALTGEVLVFWISGRLWEVVAYERWSHMEVYCNPKMMEHWEKEQIFRRRINPSNKTPRSMKLSMTLN